MEHSILQKNDGLFCRKFLKTLKFDPNWSRTPMPYSFSARSKPKQLKLYFFLCRSYFDNWGTEEFKNVIEDSVDKFQAQNKAIRQK